MKVLLLSLLMSFSFAGLADQAKNDAGFASDSAAFINFMNNQVKSQILFGTDSNQQLRLEFDIIPAGCRPRTVCTTDSDCNGGKCELHSNFPPPNGPRYCVCY